MSIHSLKNQKEFDLINKYGAKINGPYFIIICAKNLSRIKHFNSDHTFLGIKVGKKFSKKAVIRNKAKRITRHLIRSLVSNNSDFVKNKGFIIIPKEKLLSANFSKIKLNLQKIFLQLIEN